MENNRLLKTQNISSLFIFTLDQVIEIRPRIKW